MKQSSEESKKSLEQGYAVLTEKAPRVQPNQNARLNGKEMSCEDDEANEMDD